MTLVVDASVAFKWVHAQDEQELEPARALLAAQTSGRARLHLLDLTLYEVANALLNRGGTVEAIRSAVRLLERSCPVLTPDREERMLAASLAVAHGLTFYDASYAAVAERRDWRLVTADRALIVAGLGVSPTEAAASLEP